MTTKRNSSVDNRTGLGKIEASVIILRRAADYIYNQQDNGNPPNYKAVDLLDRLRYELE